MSDPFAILIAFPSVLAALILVHELGHFSMAKFFKVRVFEFGLGFPPRILSKKRGDTLYSLNLLPLGGFVKMMGENGDDAGNPESFGSKPWWKRAIILIAGPAMNMVLALMLFFITAAWLGSPVTTNVVATISVDSPAKHAGLQKGDQIVAVDGHHTASLTTIHNLTEAHLGQRVGLSILRHGHAFTAYVIPRKVPPVGQGPVGVVMSVREQRYPLGVAVSKSFEGVGSMIMAVPNLIGNIERHGTQNVSGPVGIARMTGDAASNIPQYGLGQFLALVALLSANLGVLNILPIPALDGGRLTLVLVSGIRRKNLNPEVEGLIHLAGMAVLLLLIVLISYQDIVRWASGQ